MVESSLREPEQEGVLQTRGPDRRREMLLRESGYLVPCGRDFGARFFAGFRDTRMEILPCTRKENARQLDLRLRHWGRTLN
jgi:hypothetical protein